MSLLKKENWLAYLILTFLSCGFFSFVIAKDLNLYEKGAWYTKWYYWFIGIVLFIYPAIVVLIVLNISMQIKICKILNVPGEKYYGIPYTWLLFLIVPVIGWSSLIVMLIHIYYYPTVMIYKGEFK